MNSERSRLINSQRLCAAAPRRRSGFTSLYCHCRRSCRRFRALVLAPQAVKLYQRKWGENSIAAYAHRLIIDEADDLFTEGPTCGRS